MKRFFAEFYDNDTKSWETLDEVPPGDWYEVLRDAHYAARKYCPRLRVRVVPLKGGENADTTRQ